MASLRQAYARAAHAAHYFPQLEEILGRPWERLVDLDIALVDVMCRWLGLSRRVERASALDVPGQRSERLLRLCQHFGARKYLSGSAARVYLDTELFERNGISVEWQDFAHPVYRQLHGEFVPYLSTIDLLLNCGDESLGVLEDAGAHETDREKERL